MFNFRPMAAFRSSSSTKVSAWRRNSSAIIGGLLRKLEMTVTWTLGAARLRVASRNPIAGKQHNVIDLACDLQGVDSKFDADAAFELAASLAIVEIFCWFRDHGKAIIVEPIDHGRIEEYSLSSNVAV